MSASPPDPKTLRKTAANAALREAAIAATERKRKQAAKRRRISEIRKGALERLQTLSERRVVEAANGGHTKVSVTLDNIEPYNTSEHYEALEPVWDKLAQHFINAGYAAEIRRESTTEWFGGMDPSPGPGPTYIYLDLDWGQA